MAKKKAKAKAKAKTKTKPKPLATEIGVLENLRARTVQTKIEDGKIVRSEPKINTAAADSTQWQTTPLMGKPQPPANLGTCSACIKYDTPTSTCRETAPGFTTAPPAGTFPLMPVRWPIVNPGDWCYQWSLT